MNVCTCSRRNLNSRPANGQLCGQGIFTSPVRAQPLASSYIGRSRRVAPFVCGRSSSSGSGSLCCRGGARRRRPPAGMQRSILNLRALLNTSEYTCPCRSMHHAQRHLSIRASLGGFHKIFKGTKSGLWKVTFYITNSYIIGHNFPFLKAFVETLLPIMRAAPHSSSIGRRRWR
eukprot:SAG31_NODE_1513_length_8045_cov_5.748804_6_plen_174_part_00